MKLKLEPPIRSVHFQERDPGIQWVKDSEVAIDSNGPLDSGRTLTPNVIKMDGGYRLYYMGFGPERPRPESTGYILSAFSQDAKTWSKEPGVRMDAGGDGAEYCVWGPDVIPLPDGRFRMYFQGRTQMADGEVKSVVLSSLSDDGLNWEQEPGVRLSGANTSYGAPRCLYFEPGGSDMGQRIRLYASASPYPRPGTEPAPGEFTNHNIVSAISDDGLTFELEPGIRVPQERDLESYAVYAPEILRLADGSYRMYYAGWTFAADVPSGSKYHGRIFSAVSEDGLNWIKDTGICLDNGGRWDKAKASEPCVIDLEDGRFRMFYEACDYEGQWRIATATSQHIQARRENERR